MSNTGCEKVFEFTEADYPQEWKMAFSELEYAKINWKRNVDMSGWNFIGVCDYENKGLVHFFTHKCHPYTRRNEYYYIPVSEQMKEVVSKKLEEKKIVVEVEEVKQEEVVVV